MGGNKYVPFVNSLKGNSGAHYKRLGKDQLNDLILYWLHISFMGAKFHNLRLGPKA